MKASKVEDGLEQVSFSETRAIKNPIFRLIRIAVSLGGDEATGVTLQFALPPASGQEISGGRKLLLGMQGMHPLPGNISIESFNIGAFLESIIRVNREVEPPLIVMATRGALGLSRL